MTPDQRIDRLHSIKFNDKGYCSGVIRQPDGRQVRARIFDSYYLGRDTFMIISDRKKDNVYQRIPLLVQTEDPNTTNVLVSHFVLL